MERQIVPTPRNEALAPTDEGPAEPQAERSPAASGRKVYAPPHMVCVMPLEARAGSPLWDDIDPETGRPIHERNRYVPGRYPS